MKAKHINLSAYDNFEQLDAFEGDMDAYRKVKLASAAGHVAFLKNLFPGKKITAIELGSGNSKTMFALEKAGMLEKGYCLEVSRSRYEFAQLWKKEWGFKVVENINENVLRVDFSEFGAVNLCFCVDLTFQFFEPIQKDLPPKILGSIHKQLTPGGKIILEVDGLNKVLSKMRGNSVKFWEEFTEPDSWQYSLWECRFNEKNKVLDITKVFLKRDEFGKSKNRMILRIYSKTDMQKLLQKVGFSQITFYQNWKGGALKNDKGEFIVVGTK